jgi:hypothetical protein
VDGCRLACAVASAEMAHSQFGPLGVSSLRFEPFGGVSFAVRSVGALSLRFVPLGASSLWFDPFGGVSFAV